MRRIRQLLALHFGAGASSRTIGQELGIAPSTVREYLARAAAAGVGWPLAADDTDENLRARLFVNAGVRAGARFHAEPDWSALVRELKRPGVNLLVLWEEYRAVHPEGYAYSRFCQLFREFERRLSPVMRQSHVAGHKAFVDYSGKRAPITDPVTGQVRMAEVFVAVLGASSLTYAEATWTQTLPDWLGAGAAGSRRTASAGGKGRRCAPPSARTCACSASGVPRRGCWCRTTSRAASTRLRSTTPR
jgi:hypothetical protein